LAVEPPIPVGGDPMDDRARDFVLRALAASEIAESCHEPSIRASFLALAEHWLARAGEAEWLGGERVRATA
jgi:hypothetical protein